VSLPFSSTIIAFFEKNEKEPKKNGKRKQKERNSVTSSARPWADRLTSIYLERESIERN
jgi:hypothetical protein